jgi:hypothetical protein
MVLQLESALHIMVLKKDSKPPDMVPQKVLLLHTTEPQKEHKQPDSAQLKEQAQRTMVPITLAQREHDSARTERASAATLSVWVVTGDSADDAGNRIYVSDTSTGAD